MIYISNKWFYLLGFLFLVSLCVKAFSMPAYGNERVFVFRLYTVSAIAGVFVGCILGILKRNKKHRIKDK